MSFQQLKRRIPEGVITGEIPLEAAKAFPTRIFQNLPCEPRIAYADLNTKGEKNTLSVKLLPEGAVTARHPQIVLFVKGAYHTEKLLYLRSNPFDWETWLEVHFEARYALPLASALLKAHMQQEGIT